MSWRERPVWAVVEIVAAVALIAAGLQVQSIAFMLGSAPWLMALGALLIWWRGPGWGAAGLGRPSSVRRTVVIGVLVGLGYQCAGTYVVEPLVARLTTGALPDVSQFRSLVGNEAQLVFWLVLSWTLAAFAEELAYRGWLLNRCAEVGRFSRGAWIAGLIGSSALFGIVHAYQGVSGMVTTGLTGVVFGATYLATGRNLWAAVIAHGTLDTAGFVMMYAGVYPGI